MENHQVADAIYAVGLSGPAGTPLLIISSATHEGSEHLVFLASFGRDLREVKRKIFFPGPIHNTQADLWSAEIGELGYHMIAHRFGVQGELEIASGIDT